MKRMLCAKWTIAAAGLLAILLASAGCEDRPSGEGIDNYFANNPYQSQSRPSPQQAPPGALTISPASASASPGQLINFQATGGTSPFSWSVATPAFGTITPQGNTRYAIYTHLGSTNNQNNIVLRDAAGTSAIANIN